VEPAVVELCVCGDLRFLYATIGHWFVVKVMLRTLCLQKI
jgi:hypothetical protein